MLPSPVCFPMRRAAQSIEGARPERAAFHPEARPAERLTRFVERRPGSRASAGNGVCFEASTIPPVRRAISMRG